MTHRKVVAVVVALTLLPAIRALHARATQDGSSTGIIALTGASVIDGTGSAARANMTVVVEGRRIAAVFPTGSATLPSGATVIDMAGKFILPGLIDSHVHLGTQPRDSGMMEAVLRSVFVDGVTSVRDMGGSMRVVVPLARKSLEDSVFLPRIYYSAVLAGPGRWFEGPFGEHAAGGLPMGESPLVRRVDGSSAIERVVADARREGATGIKIYNGMDSTLVRRFATEAHRQGLKVWTHFAIGPARPAEIIRAGADVVSHADQFRSELLSPAAIGTDSVSRSLRLRELGAMQPDDPDFDRVIAGMKKAGTVLDPTLSVMLPRERPADTSSLNLHRVYGTFRFSAAVTKRAAQAGIAIVAGTDAIGGSTANLHLELQLLVDSAGLTPLQALRAATLNGAISLGASDSLGTVAAGKLADLLILCADPSANIRNTQAVYAVMRAGRLKERTAARRPGPLSNPPDRMCR